MNKTVKMLLETFILLLLFTLALSACSNPVQVYDNSVAKNQVISKDSVDPRLAEITVWQMFRDPTDPYDMVYRAVQRDEGFFSTYDSIAVEAKGTLYSIGFEIEWNTHRHIYSLNKVNYRGSGWISLDLQCSKKYEITRVN
jgi:hypothetical protein